MLEIKTFYIDDRGNQPTESMRIGSRAYQERMSDEFVFGQGLRKEKSEEGLKKIANQEKGLEKQAFSQYMLKNSAVTSKLSVKERVVGVEV